MRRALLSAILLAPVAAYAQQGAPILPEIPLPQGEGWAGFLEFGFLAHTLLTLIVAAVLGAVIAYHPKHIERADTLSEIEAPKVFIMYSVIGAISGILVVKYTIYVGFVLFGIGGLIRFRTILSSPSLTGRVIFTMLIGLTTGMNLPHVAVLATLFAFALIYILEAQVTYRVDVQGLEAGQVGIGRGRFEEVKPSAGSCFC